MHVRSSMHVHLLELVHQVHERCPCRVRARPVAMVPAERCDARLEREAHQFMVGWMILNHVNVPTEAVVRRKHRLVLICRARLGDPSG